MPTIRSGLIGRDILASRSPWLHEEEARAQGLELTYELFDFTARGWDDSVLPDLLATLRSGDYAGFNVTYPFKQAIVPLLDALEESATLVGAVNTVAARDGRLIGHNTDMLGFGESFVAGLAGVDIGTVLQLGAGGAGSAVANALLLAGVAELRLYDVDAGRSAALADRLAQRFGTGRVCTVPSAEEAALGADGIVNSTPIGMAAHPGVPIAETAVSSHHWVADVIYFPRETELLRLAAAKGCRTLDGTGMVIGQAARAFEIITGHPADAARMRESFGEAAN